MNKYASRLERMGALMDDASPKDERIVESRFEKVVPLRPKRIVCSPISAGGEVQGEPLQTEKEEKPKKREEEEAKESKELKPARRKSVAVKGDTEATMRSALHKISKLNTNDAPKVTREEIEVNDSQISQDEEEDEDGESSKRKVTKVVWRYDGRLVWRYDGRLV